MASGGSDISFLCPFSFTYKGVIPGLGIGTNTFQPLNKLYDECSTGKVGTCRSRKEFQVPTVIKRTLPLIVYAAYDLKKEEPVTLAVYKKLEESNTDFRAFLRETTLLETLKHPNILQFLCCVYGVSVDSKYLKFEPFECFLSQLIQNGNEVLFEPAVIKCIMHQLLTGLEYLHDQGVVHRDITPKNICFVENGILKISNFRSARRIEQRCEPVLTLEFRYQPVDLLLGSELNNTATDIWSAACILAELLLKKPLFQVPGREGVLNKIFCILGFPTAKLWLEFRDLPDYKYLRITAGHSYNCLELHLKRNNCFPTALCVSLLQGGLVYNPEHRLTVKECLNHYYFNEEPKACLPKFLVRILDRSAFQFPVEY